MAIGSQIAPQDYPLEAQARPAGGPGIGARAQRMDRRREAHWQPGRRSAREQNLNVGALEIGGPPPVTVPRLG